MITIDFLKDHLHTLPDLAQMWYDGLGKIWIPDVAIDEAERRFSQHAHKEQMPLTLVALHEGEAVGMCSLRENDGIRPDLKPWLGSLAVTETYRQQGIGRKLIDAVKQEAKRFGFSELYLFAFDHTIPQYYQSLGWEIIDTDTYNGHPVTVMKIQCN